MQNKAILYILLSILISTNSLSFSQNREDNFNSQSLSLDEAMRCALANSPALHIQKLKQLQAEAKLSQTKSDRLPNIYGSADLRRNLVIPSTPIPASVVNPNASADEMLYMKFSTPWTSAVGLNLSYDIFNPETAGLVSERRQQANISKYDVQLSENELRANLSQTYAECVIAQSQLQSLVADTTYYFRSLAEAQDLYAKEKITRIEKNNAQSAFNASKSRYLLAENVLQSAKTDLLLLMGEEISTERLNMLHLSEDIPVLYAAMLRAFENESGNALPTGGLNDLRGQELVSLTANQAKHAALKYMPALSLSGFYGANYYDRTLNLGVANRWFGNSFVALSLKVPVSRSLSTVKEVSHMRLQEQMERENLRDRRNRRNRDWVNETAQLEVRKKEYKLKEENYALANQNLTATQAQYAKGYIQESDLAAERMKTSNAYQEYLQSAYQVFTSYVTLEKLRKE